ncbi:MAG TPA: TetR/AcrR family transcriptional regulator [Bacteroidales bacterium]|nr:TetR/AcrR family transcriptional regulator [Bacteroidales bacterium]
MEKTRNVEQDIIEAARKVFQKNGFREATMRDIANEANINLAMVHYYFRSKDNLFYIVFDEAFRMLYEKITKIITNEKLDIFEKIRILVNEYISFFNKNPQIPLFIVREIIRNPEEIGDRMKININPVPTFNHFACQLQEEYEKGTIRKISALSLVINIISLCVFPALAKSIIINVSGLTEVEMEAIAESRKKEVADFIINSIRV